MSRSSFTSESGSATAEFMILVPWLMVLVGLALGLFKLGLTELEITSQAHQIARLVSRTDSLQVPSEFEKSEYDIEILELDGKVCATVTVPALPAARARACSPSLGR